MADKDADLKIGADTSQAEAQFDKMAQSAMTAGQRIQSSFRESGTQASEAMLESLERVHGEFEKVVGIVERFQGAMLAIGAVFAGGEMFEKFVEKSVEMSESARNVGAMLGLSAEAAGELETGLKLVGLSGQDYVDMSMKLDRQVRTNEEGLRAMGLQVRDASGNLKNQAQIMEEAFGLLQQYQAGTDRNMASQMMFGRSVGDVTNMMRLNNEMKERAREDEEALGLAITDTVVEANLKYKVAMAEVGLVLDGVSKTIGDTVIPALTSMAEWFRSIGPGMIEATRSALDLLRTILDALADTVGAFVGLVMDGFKAIAGVVLDVFGEGGDALTAMQLFKNSIAVVQIAITALKLVFEEVFEAIRGILAVGVTYITAFATAAWKAFTTPWATGEVARAWQVGLDQVDEIVAKSTAKRLKMEQDAAEKMKAAVAAAYGEKPKHEGDGNEEHGKKHFVDPKAGAKDKSRMSGWEADLADLKVYYQKAADLREFDKQQENQYWQAILRDENVSSEERIAIRRKIAQNDLDILKKANAQKIAMNREAVDAAEKSALDGVTMDEEMAKRQYDLGQISKGKLLALEQQFEDQRFDIQQQAQQARVAATEHDPNHSDVELQKEKDKLLDVERKHALEVAKIQTDMANNSKEEWAKLFQPITSAIEKSITGMIMGTTTLKKALSGIGQAIVGEFVSMEAKKVAAYIASQLSMTTATEAGAAARTATETAASTESLAMQAANALKAIGNSAAQAFAGEVAFLAPYLGPMAVPAAIGIDGLVLAAGSRLMSAEGGFDIPAGVNPLTQLHEQEMVLPAQYAEVIRGMAGAGGSNGGGDIHIHSRSDSDVVRVGDMKKLLKQMNRNFIDVKH
ncbi:MAG: hypothetical protein PHY45_02455 [Rhodocyclaceae bacterium]|nr:hypothetical protein [Rhodocyclaceae bacterium]